MCDMYSIENKSEDSRAIQNNSEKHVPTAQFKDNRSLDAVEVGKNTTQLEKKENLTGMPDNLKEGIESLSGFSMDDVRVHYNSSKPATVQALAYTQGTDIHVAPGQEKHLPHEAWHVAQQMAGRVSPTTNINGMPVNDNAGLEHEADVMGEKAVMQRMKNVNTGAILINNSYLGCFDTIQKVKISGGVSGDERNSLIDLGKQVWALNNIYINGVGKYVFDNVLTVAEKKSIGNLNVSFGKNKYQDIRGCAPVVIKAFNEGLSRINYNTTLNILNNAKIALNKIVGYRDEYKLLMERVGADYRTYRSNTAMNRGFNNHKEITTRLPVIRYIVKEKTVNGFFIENSFTTDGVAFHRVVPGANAFVWHLWPRPE